MASTDAMRLPLAERRDLLRAACDKPDIITYYQGLAEDREMVDETHRLRVAMRTAIRSIESTDAHEKDGGTSSARAVLYAALH